jgi:NAD(P)H-nitrite reductase large subunit
MNKQSLLQAGWRGGFASQSKILITKKEETMNLKKEVCSCRHITKGDLKKAIEHGAASYKEVKAETKVGCGCGHCKESAKQTVEKLLEEQSS